MDHPHICKLVEVFSDPDGGDYILVSERAEAPILLDFIDEHGLPNGDLDIADCIRQILSGLAHGHERGIVHGRLRHDVLLLAAADGGGRRSPQSKERRSAGSPDEEREKRGTPQVKICDMGLGYVLREPLTLSTARYEGLLYAPPENAWKEIDEPRPPQDSPTHSARHDSARGSVHSGSDATSEVQPLLAIEGPLTGVPGHWSETKGGAAPPGADKVDVWAVGVLAFNMLSGLLPFEASDEEKLMHHLRCHKPKFTKELWSDLPSKACNAVDMMLKLVPEMRPSATDMLRHPWLRLTRSKVSKPRIFSLYRNAIVNLYEGQFKKLVHRIIAKQLSNSHEHKLEATEVFRALDKDRDGLLSFEEFTAALKKVPQLTKYLVDTTQLFEAVDRNGSGALDVHEFIAATLPPKEVRDEKNLWYCFRAFDRNESGSITLDEVNTCVQLLEGPMLSTEQITELEGAIRVELETLGFGKNLLVSLGVHDHDDESQFARAAERFMGIMPFGHRRLDFGEFAYLVSMRDRDFKVPSWGKKEMYRCVDICCDVDMYHQAHRIVQLAWPPMEGASARTPESVYERKGLSSDKDKKAQSRKRASTHHRYSGRASQHHRESHHHSPGRESHHHSLGRESHGPQSGDGGPDEPHVQRYSRFHPTHHGHHWHHNHHHADGEHHHHRHHHAPGEHDHHHHHHHYVRPGDSARSRDSARHSPPGSARPSSARHSSSPSQARPPKPPPKKKPKQGTSDYDSEVEDEDEEDEDGDDAD
jgi:serine/threonine protein kinase